jgi:chromosome segregation ATPase
LAEKFNDKLVMLKGDYSGKKHANVSKELKGLFVELKENSRQKQVIYDAIEKINYEITELENKKVKAEKKVHHKYNKVDMLEKGIKYYCFYFISYFIL